MKSTCILIILHLVAGLTNAQVRITADELMYKEDPMEKSAQQKSSLPWFARFQVGDPPVEGFPGETEEEKQERMQAWLDA